MTYRAWFATVVLLAACGDNRGGDDGPDGGPDGGAAPVDLTAGSWDPRFTIAGVGGHDGIAPAVYDFARDTDGSIVAAGRFQWFEGRAVAPLLRWRDGAWSPARTTWELAPPQSGFAAVAIAPDGDLALATNDDFGERRGEIWVDDGSGLRSIGALSGQVRTLVWSGGRLWVAGRFMLESSGAAIEHLAIWDGTSWSAPPGGASDGPVYELTLDPDGDRDGVLVGGSFTTVGGIAAHKVARYDGAAWTAFDLPGGLAVFALTRDAGGVLYAGGSTVELDGSVATGGLMQWSGSAWTVVGGGLATRNLPGLVSDVIAHDGVVDAVGCFTSAGGAFESEGESEGALTTGNVARWTGTAWQAIDDGSSRLFAPWYVPLVCGDEGPAAIWDTPHQRLAVHGSLLLHGGLMAGGGDALSQALVAYDGTRWVAQGQSGAGFGGALDRIAASRRGTEVYGFGLFSHVAGTPTRAQLVRFRDGRWSPIADTFTPDSFCLALAVSPGGEATVGCIEGLFRVEGDALVQVPVAVPGVVQHLAYDDRGGLWIAGGGDTGETGFLARLDGTQLTVVEDGFDGIVTRVDVRDGGDLVVGGSFTHVGAVAANRVARWDGAAWSPLGDGLPAQVHALARDGDTVYASTYDEGAGFVLVGAFDGTTWRELATAGANLTARADFSVEQLAVIDGTLVAVGTLALDDDTGRGALYYRDGRFTALGGGVGAITVGGVTATADAVWIAGWIAEAGHGDTRVPSIGVARWLIARTTTRT